MQFRRCIDFNYASCMAVASNATQMYPGNRSRLRCTCCVSGMPDSSIIVSCKSAAGATYYYAEMFIDNITGALSAISLPSIITGKLRNEVGCAFKRFSGNSSVSPSP